MPPSGPPPVSPACNCNVQQPDQGLEQNHALQRRVRRLEGQLARIRGLLMKAAEAATP